MKPRTKTVIGSARRQSGRPGAGKGQKEVVRGSHIYPASGPLPPGRAKVKTPASLGRREPSASAAGTRAVMVTFKKRPGKTKAALARTLPKRAAVHRKVAPDEFPHYIERENWKEFLDDFSAEHEAWTAEIQVFQPDQTSRIEAHDLPLEGISVDLKPDEAVASVTVGEQPPEHFTHTIPHTTRITALNEHELEIESADRSRTILRCRERQG